MGDAWLGYKLREFEQRLDRIEALLTRIVAQGDEAMARDQEILALIDQVNTNMNEMADQVQRITQALQTLQNEVANGTTATGSQSVVDRLAALVTATQTVEDGLRAIGANPANPTPPVQPVDPGTTPVDPPVEPSPEPAPAPAPVDGQQ